MLTTGWRLLRLVEHLITGTMIGLWIHLLDRLGHPPAWTARAVRWWNRRLCRVLGLTLEVSGRVAPGALVVANHVSWLDVPVLGAQGEMGFLSKSEVRRWPLIGWLARLAGTHFIVRGAHQTEQVMQGIADDLRGGRAVVIFPEGTTSDGQGLRRFHPRLFALAQIPGTRVQPVAIRYQHADHPAPERAAAYTDDDNLVLSLLRIVRHPALRVRIECLAPLAPVPSARRHELAEQTRTAIARSLDLQPEAA
ncbi:1-acyl-sn-glycerol-3-phosphate acyltransferase [Marichromatium gracile]|uniref:lysophospholipid acyltransferase family protein n=1 Tax=Marichromatium gracile TaxID=1048 RepID=UPI001F318C3D|nr:lysophospholipid acyltransferase family protein [Marichromatium gracile]MCF1182812.1 1-acyl-sn-glycerol-3-phosphate acyltransferase [Marichromatium gracile]